MTAFKPIPFEIYRAGTAPDPPPSLGEHGRKLWRDILGGYDVSSVPDLTILAQACACYDRAEALRAQIERDGETIATAGGSTKANPLLVIELQARALLARLLGKLNLKDEPKRGPGRPPKRGGW
jgi:P27 family predicted phage terminase small subunit